MSVTMLEYVLCLTGVMTFGLASWALHDSYQERHYLMTARVNGLKWATVNAHVSRDVARVTAAMILMGAGGWLVVLPDDDSAPALVAKHALMFLGWCMSISVFADRTMRRRIHEHLAKY